MHAALILAPLLVVAIASGQPIWLQAAIVSGSAFIVMEKTDLAPLVASIGPVRSARAPQTRREGRYRSTSAEARAVY
jgi:hypothetical protein